MTETYFPFDAGAGANVTEDQWMKMANLWSRTGVVNNYANQLAVTGDSSGMNVKVATGAAWMRGGYYENDAIITLAIAASHATLDRIDQVVVGIDWINNTITSYVLTGTPATPGAQVPPTLTQTVGVKWEISLAQVAVAHTITVVTAGCVTDEQIYTGLANGSMVLPAPVSFTNANGNYDVLGLYITLPVAGTYMVTAVLMGHVQLGTGSYAYMNAKLHNLTDNVDIPNTETMVVFIGFPGYEEEGSATISAIITVTKQTVIRTLVARDGGTTYTISNIESSNKGRSYLNYRQLN